MPKVTIKSIPKDSPHKVAAIKQVRYLYSLDLKDGKAVVENLMLEHPTSYTDMSVVNKERVRDSLAELRKMGAVIVVASEEADLPEKIRVAAQAAMDCNEYGVARDLLDILEGMK